MSKPVADIVACLDDPKEKGKSKYVVIGPLWLTEKGTLSGSIEAEPIAWRDTSVPRAIIISPRPGVEVTLKDQRKPKFPRPPKEDKKEDK